MSFSPLTYKYSLNQKNNKTNVPTSPYHCNCCACHCSCCCCHCKCLCHLISTKSTAQDKKFHLLISIVVVNFLGMLPSSFK